MPKRYMPLDEEAQTIFDEVREQHHGSLADFDIAVQFQVNEDKQGRLKYPKPNKSGNVALGKAKCYSAADRAAGCPDFLIWFLYNFWEDATDEQRRALVDHELCHCGAEEDPGGGDKPISLPHEFEGFIDELRRHGPWDHLLKQVDKQLSLWRDGEDGEAATDEDAVERLAHAPAFLKSARELCPKDGGGVTEVTISGPGLGRSVTLTSETRRRVDEILEQESAC